MKIAVISDIHGNIEALNTVLEDIKVHNCDKIICLGDLVGYGPHPNEVIEKIIESKISTIMGNYDEAVGFYLPHCGCNIDTEARKRQSKNSLKWTSENTTEEHKAFLRQLPEEQEYECQEKIIYATHGSPFAINEYIYGHQEERLQELAEEVEADIILLGHTHMPFVKRIGGKTIMHPGSVGKPKDGDNRAGYGLIEIKESIECKLVRVSYDINKVVEDINQTSLLKEFGLMLSLGKMIE
ncbi:phosphoesterase, MJ0936 family [Anaerovirgula multivorans]|uniref:Phosphoesterase n=1 Tax=Anaerovirgula multivorans TaxID=312168 RepID=A0A239AUY8_9FIRM|nr:metallophosphoesterase family protein [Anaerovirgula multivorans]SNR99339.1 phosphoesterase, MJ0936 family [Anaerovirgula multivorans]